MGERRGAYRALVGRPEGNSTLRRSRIGRDYDSRIVLQEAGLRDMKCVTTDISQFLICPCTFLTFQALYSMTLSAVANIAGGRIL